MSSFCFISRNDVANRWKGGGAFPRLPIGAALWAIPHFIANIPSESEKIIRRDPLSIDFDPARGSINDVFKAQVLNFAKTSIPLIEQEKDLKNTALQTSNRLKELSNADSSFSDCGNKYQNLMEMARVINALQLEDLIIPAPQGISTHEVKTFWEKRHPEILTYWRQLQQFAAEYQDAIPFLEHPQSAAFLEKVHRTVGEALSAHCEIQLPEEWLSKKKGCFLMVRSSGSEDSDGAANAGGNESISYVSASDRTAIRSAIGSVIQSYFSKTSLQNRINAGQNPFEGELSLGVVLQELIGEPVGGAPDPKDIPISFVLFTNEPLFIGSEPFRVMQVSATYGHGEAVVGDGRIATDTIFILHSVANPSEIYIVYETQAKTERLVPIKTDPVKLGIIPNPQNLVHQRALSDEQILKLYRDAILVEGIFEDHPTDIEGVIKNGIVHFVQARPINRKSILPTYLSSQDGVLATVHAEAIVPAQASVLAIQRREEILCAHTLQEAEERLNGSSVPKLVIVSVRPPATAHSVVNFRGLNIPCLCVSDTQTREDLLNRINGDHPLAVCMQTATLNLWDSTKANLADAIEKGFAVHPVTFSPSLPVVDPFIHRPKLSKEMEKLRNMVRRFQWEEIEHEIKQLRQEIQQLHSQAKDPLQDKIKKNLDALRHLEAYLSQTLKEAKLAAAASSGLRLRSLFYLKVLETLLIGSATETRSIGQSSLLDAKALILETEQLIHYEKTLTHPAYFAHLLPYGSFASEAWTSFLRSLEPLAHSGMISKEKIQEFHQMVQQLHQMGALSFWFTFFSRNERTCVFWKKNADIVPSIHAKDRVAMASLAKTQERMQKMMRQIGRFSNQKTFVSAWDELQTLISPFSSIKYLQALLRSSSPVVQVMVYQTMASMVDLLDRAVKELKASQDFHDPLEKVRKFKEMLAPYYDLMKTWFDLIPENKKRLLEPADISVKDYFSDINRYLRDTPDDQLDQLLPSRNFSVSAAILGARTAFLRHLPQTLEDFLTLLHQNALAALHLLNQDLLTPKRIETSFLPMEVQHAMKMIETSNFGLKVQRIGMQIQNDAIVIHYNVPLRNHSGRIKLHYDRASQVLSFQGLFLGQARERWEEIAKWIKALEKVDLFVGKTPLRQTVNELSFEWKINSPEQLEKALEEYHDMAEWSLDCGWGTSFTMDQFWNRWSNHQNINQLLMEFSEVPKRLSFLVFREAMKHPDFFRQFLNFSMNEENKNHHLKALIFQLFSSMLPLYNSVYYTEILRAAQNGIQSMNEVVKHEASLLLASL